MNLYEAQRANRHKTIGLMIVFVIFFALMGFGLDFFYLGYSPGPSQTISEMTWEEPARRPVTFPVATASALVFSLLFASFSYYTGDKMVLAATQARPIKEPSTPQEKQLLNIVDEVTIASGIPRPKVYVVPDTDPNAFATGRDPRHASIAVTQGLLNTLNRDELHGVIAHELSHVRNYDIRCMTLIAALVGAVGLLADWTMRMSYYRGGERRSRDSSKGGGGAAAIVFVIWIVAAILAPILGRILAMAVSRQREYLADATGAELTRNPLALANALRKLEQAVAPTRSIKQGMAHLCITDPLGLKLDAKEGFVADLFATHPPMAKRISRLEAMAYARPA